MTAARFIWQGTDDLAFVVDTCLGCAIVATITLVSGRAATDARTQAIADPRHWSHRTECARGMVDGHAAVICCTEIVCAFLGNVAGSGFVAPQFTPTGDTLSRLWIAAGIVAPGMFRLIVNQTVQGFQIAAGDFALIRRYRTIARCQTLDIHTRGIGVAEHTARHSWWRCATCRAIFERGIVNTLEGLRRTSAGVTRIR
jgi:hypothetical protein